MTIRRLIPLVALTIGALTLLIYAPSGAAGDNRVGIVIDYGNGQVASRCVSFAEEQISGLDALMRSGLPVEIDLQGGGAAVCRIDGQGCAASDCFCACPGGGENCVYWSYWHFIEDNWQYSAGGSGIYQVSDGDVDGWVWGLGSITQASPPPRMSFDDICSDAEAATSTATLIPTSTATPAIVKTATPLPENPTMTPTIGSGSSPTPAPSAATPALSATASAMPVTPAETGSSSGLPAATSTPAATPSPVVEQALIVTPVSAVSQSPTTMAQAVAPATSTLPQVTEEASAHVMGAGPSEPAAGMVTAALPLSADQTEEANQQEPPIVVAVVGEGASPAVEMASAADAKRPAEAYNLPGYAGFAGLLLLLSALALFVYRREHGTGSQRPK